MLNRSHKEIMLGALQCYVQIISLIVLQFSDCILGQQVMELFTIDSSIRYPQSYQSIIVDSSLQCCGICGKNDTCVAASYETNAGICELNDRNPRLDNHVDGTSVVGWMSYSTNIGPCLSGWSRYHDHCYLLSGSTGPWRGSEDNCRSLGGHLVHILTNGELNFVRTLTAITFWIGLNDLEMEGDFRWTSSIGDVNYDWFRPGEPNGDDAHDCIRMVGLEWFDTNCDDHHYSMCKKNAY